MNRCAIIHAPQSALTSFKHTRSRFQIGTKLKLLESNSVLAPLGQKQLVQKQVPWQLFTWDLQIIFFLFDWVDWFDAGQVKFQWSILFNPGQLTQFDYWLDHSKTVEYFAAEDPSWCQFTGPFDSSGDRHVGRCCVAFGPCQQAKRPGQNNQSNNFAIPTSMSVVDIDTYALRIFSSDGPAQSQSVCGMQPEDRPDVAEGGNFEDWAFKGPPLVDFAWKLAMHDSEPLGNCVRVIIKVHPQHHLQFCRVDQIVQGPVFVGWFGFHLF